MQNSSAKLHYRNKRRVGTKYETIAVQFLRFSGYDILERNFRTRSSEIDIVAMDGGSLCFIEVKYRSSLSNGLPAEAVDHIKQRRIIAASDQYLALNKIPSACRRYDIVEIVGDRIRVIKDAFGAGRI